MWPRPFLPESISASTPRTTPIPVPSRRPVRTMGMDPGRATVLTTWYREAPNTLATSKNTRSTERTPSIELTTTGMNTPKATMAKREPSPKPKMRRRRGKRALFGKALSTETRGSNTSLSVIEIPMASPRTIPGTAPIAIPIPRRPRVAIRSAWRAGSRRKVNAVFRTTVGGGKKRASRRPILLDASQRRRRPKPDQSSGLPPTTQIQRLAPTLTERLSAIFPPPDLLC
ncbi:hypothetical protein TtJL18_2433 (plasmid) [Thermus thermophilus JL-18]|mgnify:CR=1 FL=1|uniref:Uncharacterized protein n=1 Tax=Thermus thermophilus JL-18 TaxID=798128 RepID=H9ZV98_THETH|nr:hypothetical protein TtJL18_2433 [Thermus thermophilus JL-18]